MKGLADYIHAKGFKAGLYSSPGPTTCGGCAGSYGYEAQDAKTYADWGYDFLKHDWCSYENVAVGTGLERAMKPYRVMGKALREQNRDIVFSLSQYGKDDVSAWGVYKVHVLGHATHLVRFIPWNGEIDRPRHSRSACPLALAIV